MKPKVIIIAGKQGAGKTSFVIKLSALLRILNIPFGGFYAKGYWNENLRTGFDIVKINGSGSECLCNTVAEENDEQYRRFYFKQKGLLFGREILMEATNSEMIVFIDEVGGLELEGKGWATAIRQLLQNPPSKMIWTVRENLVDKICEEFRIIPDTVLDISQITAEKALETITANPVQSQT